MPVKVHNINFSFFYALSPEYSMDSLMDGLFKECLDLFPIEIEHDRDAQKEWGMDIKNAESIKKLHQLSSQYEQMRANSDNAFISIDELFENHSPLRPPLIIFTQEYFVFFNAKLRSSVDFFYPKKLFDDKDLELIQSALDENAPLRLGYKKNIATSSLKLVDGVLYLFGNQLWILTNEEKAANEEELRLLFLEFVDKERQKFEKLRRKFSGEAGAKIESRREKIPEEVRIFVWRRDEGRCVECSSQERLEFDHIIPFSKGGSNTTRNIQLLCEVCNRKKSNNI